VIIESILLVAVQTLGTAGGVVEASTLNTIQAYQGAKGLQWIMAAISI
jgi:hypothetical protein